MQNGVSQSTTCRQAPSNPRRTITDEATARLARGISEFGLVDPIIVRRTDNMVIGGHQRLKVAQDAGDAEVPVVYLDDIDDASAAALNVLLNNPSAQGDWDLPKLADVLDSLDGFDATLTGFDLGELEGLLTWTPDGGKDPDDALYTGKIEVPLYEITGDEPAVSSLYDDNKTVRLKTAIAEESMPDGLRAFLNNAADRHTVFNFQEIAEYYAHASARIQKLMEQSALIIIDFGDAIANEYVQISTALGELADRDNEDA